MISAARMAYESGNRKAWNLEIQIQESFSSAKLCVTSMDQRPLSA